MELLYLLLEIRTVSKTLQKILDFFFFAMLGFRYTVSFYLGPRSRAFRALKKFIWQLIFNKHNFQRE